MENSRENAFDFLRLFAALSVVVGHSVTHFDTTFLWYSSEGGYWFNDGVAMFFVLSGMLVYKSCNSAFKRGRPIGQYFLNRALRIIPALYVYLIITIASFFLLGILGKNDFGLGFFAWVASTLFLIPVYHPSTFESFGIGVVNGSLWTIPVEASFYAVLPLFVLIKRKLNFKIMIMTLFIISIIGLTFYNYLDYMVFEDNPIWLKLYGVFFMRHLLLFTIGMLLGEIWGSIKHSKLLALGSLILYVIVRYEVFFSRESVYVIWDFLWVVPFGYLIIWIGYNAPHILYSFTNKIGDLSYGIYIWHMVVVNYFIYYGVHDKLSGNFSVSIVLVLSIILGALSWWFIEKQVLQYKPYSSRLEGLNKKGEAEKTA